MKRCPTCGLTLDDSQTFCTNDGTTLVSDKAAPYDPQATMVIPPGGVAPPPPPTFGVGAPPAANQGAQTGWQPAARPTVPPAYIPQPGYGSQSAYDARGAERPGKFVPGLIGGLVAGLLSFFPNLLSTSAFIIVSFFCVLWAFAGGVVASMLYIKRSQAAVRPGEGALLGVIAGAIGALIYLALDTTVAYGLHGDYVEMISRAQGNNLSAGAFFAMTGVAGAVTIIAFAVIGGLVGVPMFEKRRGNMTAATPPPPPPGYGGQAGGGYR
ncbi:MAG TPA: hypothetical protein VF723_15190 [Pyrinomonadaceae bacterium]|jgi:hypothetical protein